MGIVDVTSLRKVFGENVAVGGVDFSVESGEVFGLLGPNGAGKTTTISMICGLLEPTEGDVTVDGMSVRTQANGVKKALGVIPQDIALYPTLSARENLTFWGRMYGLGGGALKAAVDDVLDIVGLADRAKDAIETFSGGMKRRINIGAGLLHRPKVLLMDEPTVGIDPQSRNHILETVKHLNKDGMTIIYTSHYMEEVEFLCDRVGIIDHGKVIALGTQEELRKMVGDADRVVVSLPADSADAEAVGTAEESAGAGGAGSVAGQTDSPTEPGSPETLPGAAAAVPETVLQAVRGLAGVTGVESTDSALTVLAKDGGAILAPLMATLTNAGVRVQSVSIDKPDLESVFLSLTGRSLRD